MKKPVTISDDEKWEAVINCDKNYDGVFFYGVKTTEIFCRPSCKSKTPMRVNVVFFDDAAKAIESGFRPCKRCCPDEIVFQPDLELIKKAKELFDDNYTRHIDLAQISKQLGVSPNHLIKLFKLHCGLTPKQYIIKIRVAKAVKLLEQTHASIVEIAYAAGFKSLSSFYKCFKDQTGYTPSEYKRSCGEL
jgi:AraC family transcriptional regulator of adaptative response / methylphosphotriester-DNA alkyltransferase methyltransferase